MITVLFACFNDLLIADFQIDRFTVFILNEYLQTFYHLSVGREDETGSSNFRRHRTRNDRIGSRNRQTVNRTAHRIDAILLVSAIVA